jgi:hypothetical protein
LNTETSIPDAATVPGCAGEQSRAKKGREGRIEEGQGKAVREGMRRKEDPMRSVKEENGEGGRE